ncbi:MAG: DUF4442 domain-containing protein [Oceanococcus sp.]
MKPISLLELKEKLNGFPISERMRYLIMSFAVGKVVPFLQTAGLKIDECDPNIVSLSLANKRKVQNHMGTIHASAISLLAEATSGLLLNMNLPGNAKYSTLTTNAEYIEIARGGIVATASFSPEEQLSVKDTDKGSMEIPVSVRDARNVEVAKFSVVWSWKK